MEFSKLAIKGDRTQKEKLVEILKELKGFNTLPIGIPMDFCYYFLDKNGFVKIGFKKMLEKLGYECITIEEYEARKKNDEVKPE
jgi:hypothetical protein